MGTALNQGTGSPGLSAGLRQRPSAGRNVGVMIASSCVNALTGVILMFWVPRLVSVDEFGYWRTFILYTGYAGFLHLGLLDGALLHWSRPREDRPGASLRQTAVVLLLEHLALSFLILFLLLTPIATRSHAPQIVTGLLVYSLAFNFLGLAQVYLQTHFKFHLVGLGMAGPGVLFVCLIGILRYFQITLNVLMVAYIIACSITAALLWRLARGTECFATGEHAGGDTNGPQSLKLNLEYIRAGWPIMLASTAYGVMQSADRITVNLSRPIHDFAIYSLAQSTIYVPIAIIIAVTRVAFSHFARASDDDRCALYQGTVQTLTLLWILLLPYFFVVEWFVQRFLPKYVPGLPAGRVLLLSVLFLSLISIVQANTFALNHRQREFFAGSVAAVALAFLTAWIGSRWIGSLTAVAWSQVFSAGVWWLGNEWALPSNRRLPTREITRVLIAFILGAGALYLAAWSDKGVVVKTLLYAAVLGALTPYLYRHLLRDIFVAFRSIIYRVVQT